MKLRGSGRKIWQGYEKRLRLERRSLYCLPEVMGRYAGTTATTWSSGTYLSPDHPFTAQNVHGIVLHQTGEPQIQVVKKGTIQHIEDIIRVFKYCLYYLSCDAVTLA